MDEQLDLDRYYNVSLLHYLRIDCLFDMYRSAPENLSGSGWIQLINIWIINPDMWEGEF